MSDEISGYQYGGKQKDSFREFDNQAFTISRMFLGVKEDKLTDQKDIIHMKLKMGCNTV
ncbi:MAG: hypothetical protein ACPLKZ_04700 [Candidatus Bathyarchaeales archaeon]